MPEAHPTEFEWTPEGLFSRRYQDRYFGRVGALRQAEEVFLAGNELPQRWAHRDTFTIVETGFGLGFNFLTTWALWRRSAHQPHLHMVSIEAHPVDLMTLARAHRGEPSLEVFARELRRQWPVPRPGVHRLHFDNGRVTLTLIWGSDLEALSAVDYQADAFYLDGFAPDKNPALWSSEVFSHLFNTARRGATLSTWCAQGDVRRRLKAVGFEVSVGPGIGDKRETTRARVPGEDALPRRPQRATIVGAGLAGSALAERLVRRGLEVHLIDSAPGPAFGASGNPAGVMRPILSKKPTEQERFLLAAFEYGLRDLASRHKVWFPTGVLHIAQTKSEWDDWHARLTDTTTWDPSTLQLIDRESLRHRFNVVSDIGAILFPRGGYAKPKALSGERLRDLEGQCRCSWNTAILGVTHRDDAWTLESTAGPFTGTGPLIFAIGAGYGYAEGPDFLPPDYRPLARQRGEISCFKVDMDLELTLSGDGYLTPALEGVVTVGATYDPYLDDRLTLEGRLENEARLTRLSGQSPRLEFTGGRAAWRSIAQDRLPIVGPDPLYPERWHCRALASRGIVSHALAAELLVSQLFDEPRPLDRKMAASLAPDRTILKHRATRRERG